MMNPDGRDADNILQGSTLSGDGHSGKRFDYMLANPPYGYDWKRDEEAVRAEYDRGERGRFYAGLPRISDGQLLFLQHMLGRMKSKEDGGSRVCIIMNGSPLFTGDAGSGESEIRRWILEKDLLEALVALPEQMFYNTGIATYVWVLSNRKPEKRRGKVQLINATDIWVPMRKSLGDKRRMITTEQAQQIVDLYTAFAEDDRCKLFPSEAFGYRKVTIERPLRLNFLASPERIKRLEEEAAFRKLAENKKKDKAAKAAEEKEGRKLQHAILALLEAMPKKLYKDRVQFLSALDAAEEKAGLSLAAPVRKAILNALSERDEEAEICRDSDGNPEPDSELRDYENVPLPSVPSPLKGEGKGEGESVIAIVVREYFDREVKPHVPDAWVNMQVRDEKDGEVGKVGYEVNFNRYFYKYVPPRALEAIEADIAKVEAEIAETLRDKA
jgi:type I restriction enzyme M protein